MAQRKANRTEPEGRASGYIRDAAEATKDGVDRASGYLEGVADQATDYVKETVSEAHEMVAELGSRRIDEVWADALRFTKRRPATALLIAATVGLALGLIISRES